MNHNSANRIWTLYATFVALMVLLASTVGLSFVDLGPAHTAVGLGIAVIKTLLVMLIFMNLIRSSATVRLTSGASLLWLSLLVLCVMADYVTRGWHETQPGKLQLGGHYTSYDRVEYRAAEAADPSSDAAAATTSADKR